MKQVNGLEIMRPFVALLHENIAFLKPPFSLRNENIAFVKLHENAGCLVGHRAKPLLQS